MPLARRSRLLLALCAAVPLAACGDDTKPVGEVAVKVNREAITVQQLDAELARLRGLNDAQRKGAARQVLDRLVDQELLAQQALARKLDRDPRVQQAIESSRRQILARAYLDSVTSQALPSTPDEVTNFYGAHPELFAERKVYRLQELAIGSHPELSTTRLQEELKKAKSLNDVVEWLRQEKIPFNANATVKAAEQLPLEIVPRLAALSVGQAMLMPSQQGFLIVQVAATEPRPLTLEQARPSIEQYVANQKKRELARSELATLRGAAKIEYVGDHAGGAATGGPATPALTPPLAADPATGEAAPGIGGLK